MAVDNCLRNNPTQETEMNAVEEMKKGREELNRNFAEREKEIMGLCVSLVAGEHTLLLGPPGTGKSALVNAFSEFAGMGSFDLLLTKFTTPEEVFGPVDIAAMKAGKYKRVPDGRAWDRQVVFLDEIFKASSSILNSLLTLMQERKADNGGRVDAPLEILVGASNEYPADASLDALFDRFSVKFWTDYVTSPGLKRILLAGGVKPIKSRLAPEALQELRDNRAKVVFGEKEVDTLIAVKAAIEDAGYSPSDRTWVKAMEILKARAVIDGRDKIATSDFRFLAEVLWKKHEDRAKLFSVIGNAADPYGARAEAIIDGINITLRSLPEWSTIEAGQVTKAAAQTVMIDINKKLMAEVDKINNLEDEAGDHPDVVMLRQKAKLAVKVFDELNEKVLWHRS